MRRYIPQDEADRLGLVEVYLTPHNLPNPVVVYAMPDDAARMFDVRKLIDVVPLASPRLYEYNLRMMTLLHGMSRVWPYRRSPSWGEMVEMLNGIGFLTQSGLQWTKANLTQKLSALNFNKDTIINESGDFGQANVKPQDVSGLLSAVPDVLERMEAASSGGVVDTGVGIPLAQMPSHTPLYQLDDNDE